MFGWTLRCLPFSAKVFCTAALLAIGAGNVAGIVQSATVVGLSPQAVAQSLKEPSFSAPEHVAGVTERPITFSDFSDRRGPKISTALLIQTSHTHLFALSLIASVVGIIFLFSSVAEGWKAFFATLPFAGIVIDIGGMWMSKFLWGPLALLVILGGALFALGYLVILVRSLYELWWQAE